MIQANMFLGAKSGLIELHRFIRLRSWKHQLCLESHGFSVLLFFLSESHELYLYMILLRKKNIDDLFRCI
ncbi:hypothetical protein MA16_Dca024347 [Dendrobium catenatum]|uniref:Uncharacterized protein n=1 Tax=Dendrobium catenatum TaxID=906689 RepID=A0A2I0WVG9_9ASPA|nr:hypothetical protein MA16_Dca024347 [Dendrobium catenatum]